MCQWDINNIYGRHVHHSKNGQHGEMLSSIPQTRTWSSIQGIAFQTWQKPIYLRASNRISQIPRSCYAPCNIVEGLQIVLSERDLFASGNDNQLSTVPFASVSLFSEPKAGYFEGINYLQTRSVLLQQNIYISCIMNESYIKIKKSCILYCKYKEKNNLASGLVSSRTDNK